MTPSQIDAVVSHFRAMGYAARDICRAIAALVKGDGNGRPAWSVLEESSYHLVQQKLLEMKEENLLLLEEENHQDPPQEQEPALDENEAPLQNIVKAELLANDEVKAQQQKPAVDEAPSENISEAELLAYHKVDAQQRDAKAEDIVFIDGLGYVRTVQAVATFGKNRPCHGWISESDDDEENENDNPSRRVSS